MAGGGIVGFVRIQGFSTPQPGPSGKPPSQPTSEPPQDVFVAQGDAIREKLQARTNPAEALLRSGLNPQKLVDVAQQHATARVIFADYFHDHAPPTVTSLGTLLAAAPPASPDHGDRVLQTFLDELRKLPKDELAGLQDRIEVARVPMVEDDGVADVVGALSKVVAQATSPNNNVVAINLCSDYHDMSLTEINQLLTPAHQVGAYGDFDSAHKAEALQALPAVDDATAKSWFGGDGIEAKNSPDQVRHLGRLVQQLDLLAQDKAVLVASGNGGYVQPLALAPHAVTVGVSGPASLETVMPDTYAREDGDYSSFTTPMVTAAVTLLAAGPYPDGHGR